MNRESKYYCKWADAGLALHNRGGALLCCQSRTYLQDENQQPIYWHTHTLKDAWESPTRREIQDALDNGIQHPSCNACWDEENVGGTSRRMHHLRDDNIVVPEDSTTPMLMDLKLGNLCNLACRTCNPDVSSKWYADWWHVIDQHTNQFKDYRQYLDARYLTGKLSYAANNEQLWSSLAEWFPKVQYVDIYGAEPMMIDKLFDVLQSSIDQGNADNQILHFNSNGTIWNQAHIDILSKFKQVYFDVSVDGLYDHFDYTRYGESWATISSNIEKYDNFKKQYMGKHNVSICITVSILNMYYVDEIWKYFQDRGWHCHFNIAHMPRHVNVKAIPEHAKKQIENKLSQYHDKTFQRNVAPLVSYMNEPILKDGDWEEFIRVTNGLDARRKQKFASTFPEFYDIIKNDWPQE
jgi:MoaA/NifB/PqqE/SkfB family radical SAM enzyme